MFNLNSALSLEEYRKSRNIPAIDTPVWKWRTNPAPTKDIETTLTDEGNFAVTISNITPSTNGVKAAVDVTVGGKEGDLIIIKLLPKEEQLWMQWLEYTLKADLTGFSPSNHLVETLDDHTIRVTLKAKAHPNQE